MGPSLRIESHDNGERLDALLARTYPEYSRVFFQKFMKKGGVTLAGTPREPSYRVRTGEKFEVADFESYMAEPSATKPGRGVQVDHEPDILFEDDALLVISKPAGLVVHPAPGHRAGTLIDWVKGHLGSSVVKYFTDPARLGLVHRLDKDTSGVLVIAKSIKSQTAISRQFHDRTVKKTYAAFVEGIPSSMTGVINAPVGRSRKMATRMAITPLGRAAETTFEVVESLKEVSLVTLHPKTGRTHQLRVHLSAIGHPIVGDRTYGAKSVWTQTYGIPRSLLHAEQLEINHPVSGKRVTFKAPWPADFRKAHTLFRKIFKLVLVVLTLGSFSAYAEPTTTHHKTTHSSDSSSSGSSSGSSSSTPSTKSELRKLKRDVAAIKENLDAINAAVDRVNVTDRVRDLERAVADLNSRAVGGSTGAEETKTQLLDISRKVKNQQEALEQIRDQLDRINRSLIQLQASGTSSGSQPARVTSEPSSPSSEKPQPDKP